MLGVRAACILQVKKADDSVGPAVEEAVKGMSNGEVLPFLLMSKRRCTWLPLQAGALFVTYVRAPDP